MTRRLVLDLAERRPIWRMPGWLPDRLRAALPEDWSLATVDSPADGTADGTGRASAAALAAVADAEVYVGFGVPPELVAAAPALRWVHSGTAGVGSSLTAELLERDIVFTNSAGVHAPAMAETVLAAVLYFARGLDFAVRAQREAAWDKAPFDDADSPLRELSDSTLGLIGYGGIGRAVARRSRSLGLRVLALRRTQAGTGRERWDADPLPAEAEPAELLTGAAGLRRLLEESHYLVLAAPATAETRGLLDAAALGRMRRDAVLINVSRGALVDETALAEALEAGRLRGAALDVFAEEPLPRDHPFWRLPNTLVTPHISAYTHRFWEREASLIEENLRRYLAGRPLLNVVDTRAGY